MAFYTREEVLGRKNFYRDHYRASVKLLIGALLVIALLMLTVAYLVLIRPEPVYYATASDGGLRALGPLDKPNMSSEPLIE